MQARWRSPEAQRSAHPTTLLFHCSDAHAMHGVLPRFSEGETWQHLHEQAHEAKRFAAGKEHE